MATAKTWCVKEERHEHVMCVSNDEHACNKLSIRFQTRHISLTDTGVTGGSLHNCLTGLERAILLRRLDDGQGQPILHRRKWIEELTLGIDGAPCRADTIRDLDERCIADRLADVVEGWSESFAAVCHG
jgi:hypothetical protein